MASCNAVAPQVHYQSGWNNVRRGVFVSASLSFRTSKRKYTDKLYFSYMQVRRDIKSPNGFLTTRGKCRIMRSLCYYCLQPLVNEAVVLPEWMILGDEVLLAISIIFAYLAGLTQPSSISPSSLYHSLKELRSTSSDYSGAFSDSSIGVIEEDIWLQSMVKLSGALDTISHHGSLDTREFRFQNYSKSHPLSIFAIDERPRLRLLLMTMQQLEKQVNEIPDTYELLSLDKWLLRSNDMITALVNPVFVNWLQEELTLSSDMISRELIISELKDDGRLVKSFNRSGKAELYLSLLSLLRFGSIRFGSYYDIKILSKHGVDILEDLVICLADGITSIYLELISIDSKFSSELTDRGLILCSLSTRALQRLRNEVALNWWLDYYFESVTSMYEDRFELYIISRKLEEKSLHCQNKNLKWWRWLSGRKLQSTSFQYSIDIIPFSLSVKRTKELRALTGWRYYFSLFLELSDIAMPFANAVLTKISSMVSYFLYDMIGRSLGLIFSGIKQSLRWR